MTDALLLLRAVQMGISIADMDLMTIGLIEDMAVEAANDREEYPTLATQEDIDRML